MKVFTVAMPGGTKDLEFEEYVRLLKEKGIDVSDMPRVLEKGTPNRWVYAWNAKQDAEAFARDLRARSKNNRWRVHEFDTERLASGPLGPIEIYMGRQSDGVSYTLHPTSRALVKKAFPQVKLANSVFIGYDTHADFENQFPETLLEQVAIMLTGLSSEKLKRFGGYRVYDPQKEKVVADAISPDS